MRKTNKNQTGFTLIELLIVVAIIGLLASIALVSVSTVRARARDLKRRADLTQISKALELYFNDYGTYLVAGTGYAGCGCGWLSYQGGNYVTSVIQGLRNAGYLAASAVEDPKGSATSPSYMIYLCDGYRRYAISATLENPTATDIAYIQTTCNGVGSNGTYSVYGKNFAVGR